MTPPFGHILTDYTVAVEVYEGPFDLLLSLIEKAELDITRLALAQVTDQFLAYWRALPEQSPDVASAFLVIAARLLQIKSESLLPRPPSHPPEVEDDGEALARQLIIYKRFKEIAQQLAQREALGLRTYLRQAPSPAPEAGFHLSGVALEDLLAAARLVFTPAQLKAELAAAIISPQLSIREKINLITNYLRRQPRINFSDLLVDKPQRLNIIVTFLALLELVKRQMVQARQERLFSDIEIEATTDWQEDLDFEIEF